MTSPERPLAPAASRPPQRVFHPFTFGKYYLIDRIGTGGMAEVFRALPIRPGATPPTRDDVLVIKRILPHIAENEDFVTMFGDEAKITGALRHPNVVRVFDFGSVGHDAYLAMQYVDGKDLRNVLRRLAHRERFLDLSLCAAIAHEVCRGLHYAHTLKAEDGTAYDIVHRDVSPANVLLGYDGRIKLTDFGVAKASSNANRTKSGIFKGKFDYMSPEQAEGRDIDARADIFAAGILLFEMVTCRRLFKADSEIATLQKIRESKIPSMAHYRPGIDPELEAICRKALSREREDRYASADAMADALFAFLAPRTLEEARERLEELLAAEFASEMAAEEQRLTTALTQVPVPTGPRIEPPGWEGNTPSMLATRESASSNEGLRSALTGALAMAALLIVIGGVAFAVTSLQPTWFAFTSEPASEGLTAVRSGLEIVIEPPGRVEIDGIARGEGGHLIVDSIEPGIHELRVSALDHRDHRVQVEVKEGQLTPLMVRLDPGADRVAQPTRPRPVAAVPVVAFQSTPPGAQVFVEGQPIGVTPLRWTDGLAGESYAVEMRLADHRSQTSSIGQLAPGETVFSLQLVPVAERTLLDPRGSVLPAEPGEAEAARTPAAEPDDVVQDGALTDLVDPFAPDPSRAGLTVALPGGGQAEVFVDGVRLERTAPFTDLDIAPGSHEVRVVNTAAGLDVTSTKTFEAGATVTVSAAVP